MSSTELTRSPRPGRSRLARLLVKPEGGIRWAAAVTLGVSAVLFIGLLAEVFPLAYMINNSLKSDSQIIQRPFAPSTELRFDNYREVWVGERTRQGFGIYFRNSFVVTGGTLALLIAVASMSGYALAREPFSGRATVAQLFILLLAIPAHVLMVPIYFLMGYLDLRNNLFGLILLYTTLHVPFATMLMRGFFKSFPRDLEDAAIIDGCTRFGALIRIVLPMSRNAIATIAITNVTSIYSELFFALVLMTKNDARTIPLAVSAYKSAPFSAEQVLSLQYTAFTLAALPLLLVYFLFQRQILRGMSMGAFR